MQALRQLHARSIVKEIEVRRKAGQHMWLMRCWRSFPRRTWPAKRCSKSARCSSSIASRSKHREPIGIAEDAHRRRSTTTRLASSARRCSRRWSQELNINTLDRMASYLRLNSDTSLVARAENVAGLQRLAAGRRPGRHEPHDFTVLDGEVRDLVREYLNEPVKLERDNS